MKETFCPYCGSENITIQATDLLECNDCKELFTHEDVEHNILRDKISSICSAFEATEDNPINCIREDAMELHIEGITEAAQGLSESEKPQVSTVFHDPEGIVWITFLEYPFGGSPCNSEPMELDSISINDSLKEILSWLEENLSVNALGRC